jgi:hypothetical protein
LGGFESLEPRCSRATLRGLNSFERWPSPLSEAVTVPSLEIRLLFRAKLPEYWRMARGSNCHQWADTAQAGAMCIHTPCRAGARKAPRVRMDLIVARSRVVSGGLRIGEAIGKRRMEAELSFGNKQSHRSKLRRVKLDELPFAAAGTVTPPIYHGE